MKRRVLLGILLLASLFSGCLTDQSDGAPVDSQLTGTQVGTELPMATYTVDGTLLASNPAGQCDMTPEVCTSYSWHMPTVSDDGLTQRATEVRIVLEETSPTAADLDLFVFNAEGTQLGSSVKINPIAGPGEEVTLPAMDPQQLVIEVRAYAGVASSFKIRGEADMVVVESGAPAGDVTITKQGDRWLAERTVIYERDVVASEGNVRASTGAGMVSFRSFGSDYRLEALLRGHGDSEEAARANLDEIQISHGFENEGNRLDLDVHARTGDGNWNDQEVHLEFDVPDNINWGVADLRAIAGFVMVRDISADRLTAETSAGYVSIESVAAGDMNLESSAGYVTAKMLPPLRDGTWNLKATAGALGLTVVEGAEYGYDVDARTGAGSVDFDFRDATTTSTDCEYASCQKHATTNGYEDRAVRVRVDMDTSAGSIWAGS